MESLSNLSRYLKKSEKVGKLLPYTKSPPQYKISYIEENCRNKMFCCFLQMYYVNQKANKQSTAIFTSVTFPRVVCSAI